VNASLNDPIDSNMLDIAGLSSDKLSESRFATFDIRNSLSKLDYENHQPFENLELRNSNEYKYVGVIVV